GSEEKRARLGVELLDAGTQGREVRGRLDERGKRTALHDTPRRAIEGAMHGLPRFRRMFIEHAQFHPSASERQLSAREPVAPADPGEPSRKRSSARAAQEIGRARAGKEWKT